MTTEDAKDGWWEAPPGKLWICPDCEVVSPIEDWVETRSACDDCGDHDGRECPNCGVVQDHVWGARGIRDATLEAAGGAR